ncbi:MAG: tRNA-dihydrouridine synthase family protein [Parachlamydiaceae bacterium]|nr:tRNA-dihydrouridine synthase family protein [Parachlamydiaceae bacterium]
MNYLPKNEHGCPYLLLAPMEGLGDLAFRRAMTSIGGFDESCTEFLRVPANGHVKSLAKRFVAGETDPIPQAAQIMGSNPELMADMTHEIVKRGAPRVDLNCGCPSNTVTGRGAGSSLLKEPNHLYKVAKAMVDSVDIPVTAKLRAGFDDTSLFKENLLAAQESGIKFLTLHARTKADGYVAPARWELISEAKQLLSIPVIGNGDILTVQDAVKMLQQTNCDGLMIGRGSAINPFIFQEIRCHFANKPYKRSWEHLVRFFEVYMENIPAQMPVRNRMSKLKQLACFLFKGNAWLEGNRQTVLRSNFPEEKSLYDLILNLLKESDLYINH